MYFSKNKNKVMRAIIMPLLEIYNNNDYLKIIEDAYLFKRNGVFEIVLKSKKEFINDVDIIESIVCEDFYFHFVEIKEKFKKDVILISEGRYSLVSKIYLIAMKKYFFKKEDILTLLEAMFSPTVDNVLELFQRFHIANPDDKRFEYNDEKFFDDIYSKQEGDNVKIVGVTNYPNTTPLMTEFYVEELEYFEPPKLSNKNEINQIVSSKYYLKLKQYETV